VLLPAPLKATDTFLQNGFFLKRSVFSLFELYPMAEWDLMMSKSTNLTGL
jgi:hypothetical protein